MDWRALANAWLELDLNPSTRRIVQKWLDDGDEKQATACLGAKRLAFGTAGLRGPMGVGYSCMNDVVVLQAAQGLCHWAAQKFGEDKLKEKGIVIGFDARRNEDVGVSSRRFAHLTAAVFLSKGVKVQLFSKFAATPLVPFLQLRSQALCGVVVTASHNPKADNGYKVYGPNGAQICAPVDTEISESISTNLQRWEGVAERINAETGDLAPLGATAAEVSDPFEMATAAYFSEMAHELCSAKSANEKSPLKFVYTAMHGVGHPFTVRMLEEFGFVIGQHVFVEERQRDPDPTFPTVSYPNPEEKGALSLSMDTASKLGANYILANDPDADRFTAAERSADGTSYVQFTGDELGTLFADWVIQRALSTGRDVSRGLLVNSAVSSRMLEAVAKHHGCVYSDALTGFKWLANCAATLCADKGLTHFLAYEEAIGYQLSPLVRDKDGISACAVFCELATHWSSQGLTVRGRLEAVSKEVGYFATHNGYFLCYNPDVMKEIFDEFRNSSKKCDKKSGDTAANGTGNGSQERTRSRSPEPTSSGGFPTVVGGLRLRSVRDVTRGLDTSKPDMKSHLPATPKDQMLSLYFENGASITLRGSGTEPKLKYYAEASDMGSKEAAKERAASVANAVIQAVLQPERYGLQNPKV